MPVGGTIPQRGVAFPYLDVNSGYYPITMADLIPPFDPHFEYASRLEKRKAVVARLQKRHVLMGNLKVALTAWGAMIAWMSFGRHWVSAWWLAAPIAALVVAALIHERLIRVQRLAERAVAFYERGVARLEDRWAGTGETGERFDDPSHPYAEDLDLFGHGSVFELLSTTRLRAGEEALAGFLLHPAGRAEIPARQQAITELRPRLDLREEMALLGEDLRSEVNPRALAAWAEQPLLLDSGAARSTAAGLSLVSLASAVAWAWTGVPEYFLGAGILAMAFFLRFRSRVSRVVELVGTPAYGLGLLSEVLGRLEREKFTSPRLVAIRQALDTEGTPPSHAISRLNRLMDLLHSRDNVAVKIIGPPLLWTTQVAFALEAWRKKYGPAVRRWATAVGEFEALSALGGYAYEHPADCFPEFVEGGVCFEGEGLAHPLLSDKRAVRNDVSLCGELRVLVVSGSNMSGKSTLLRTVGVNAVLALAGAPVRARKLRMSPVAVGASIRTLDSLQGGASRFYTEIKRLRLLVDLTRERFPLLFLCDELLHGTNSHDRKAGAEGVVRTLVDRGAIGLLTTHDLALAHMGDALKPHVANVHFEDHLENGKILFDYTLRPGLIRKSNALELMRSVGLDV